MKKIITIFVALVLTACSNDDDTKKLTGVIRYEAKIVNGYMTNVTRPATDPNALCGEITESGVEELPGQNVNYQWVVVCE